MGTSCVDNCESPINEVEDPQKMLRTMVKLATTQPVTMINVSVANVDDEGDLGDASGDVCDGYHRAHTTWLMMRKVMGTTRMLMMMMMMMMVMNMARMLSMTSMLRSRCCC